jgi:hypothetical protein
MPQFEAQVPDPWREDLPGFLSTSGVVAPTIRVVLAVFLRENGFQGTTMPGQRHHIRCRKGFWRQ